MGTGGTAIRLAMVSVISLTVLACSADENQSPAQKTPGMELIAEFECHRSETKLILVQGVEDNFSLLGEESPSPTPDPASMPERKNSMVGFDATQGDRYVIGRFSLPANLANAMLVTSFRPIGDNANDNFVIGWLYADGPEENRYAFSERIAELDEIHGWQRQGNIYWTSLLDLPLRPRDGPLTQAPERTFGDFLAGPSAYTIDYRIADDTAVDFIAIAACAKPKEGTGLTLQRAAASRSSNKLNVYSCNSRNPREQNCDPYLGDTPCTRKLPILCLKPGNRSVPDKFASVTAWWTGGEMRETAPVRAADFRHIDDADSFCAMSFGDTWRVATIHDGGNARDLAGPSVPHRDTKRVWVDIRGQPYATCWAHE